MLRRLLREFVDMTPGRCPARRESQRGTAEFDQAVADYLDVPPGQQMSWRPTAQTIIRMPARTRDPERPLRARHPDLGETKGDQASLSRIWSLAWGVTGNRTLC